MHLGKDARKLKFLLLFVETILDTELGRGSSKDMEYISAFGGQLMYRSRGTLVSHGQILSKYPLLPNSVEIQFNY